MAGRVVVLSCCSFLLLLSLVSLVPGAEAQGAVGRFYVTDNLVDPGPTSCNPNVLASYEGSMDEPPAGKAYSGTSLVGLACAFWVRYTVEEAFTLSGDIDVKFWVGCEVASATIELDYALYIAGDEVIFERPGVVGECVGGTGLIEGGGVHPSQGASAEPGDLVEMRFNFFSGPEPGLFLTGNVFMTTGGDHPSGFSAVGLPVQAGGDDGTEDVAPVPQTHNTSLTGAEAHVEHAFADPTSDTYVYDWPTDLFDVSVAYNATVENGTARVVIEDGEGVLLLDLLLEASVTDHAALSGVAPGNWTITIGYSDFMGRLDLTVTSPAEGEGEEGESATLDEGPETATKKGLPGPGVVALLALLAACAAPLRPRPPRTSPQH